MNYGVKSLAFAVVVALVFSVSGAYAGNGHNHNHNHNGFGGFPGNQFPHQKKHIHHDAFFFPPHFHQQKKFVPPFPGGFPSKFPGGGFPGGNFHPHQGGGIHFHFGK